LSQGEDLISVDANKVRIVDILYIIQFRGGPQISVNDARIISP
jgi:hypothetical protein